MLPKYPLLNRGTPDSVSWINPTVTGGYPFQFEFTLPLTGGHPYFPETKE